MRLGWCDSSVTLVTSCDTGLQFGTNALVCYCHCQIFTSLLPPCDREIQLSTNALECATVTVRFLQTNFHLVPKRVSVWYKHTRVCYCHCQIFFTNLLLPCDRGLQFGTNSLECPTVTVRLSQNYSHSVTGGFSLVQTH